MTVKALLGIAALLLAGNTAFARENMNHLDFPAKEMGLKNHGTLTTLPEGAWLIALSDDIADLAYTYDYDGDGLRDLVFHTRRVPRNPFFVIFERVVVKPKVGASEPFQDVLAPEIEAAYKETITLKDGSEIPKNLVANPTDPGRSQAYVNEQAIDDVLQMATEKLGATEFARYPVLQLIGKVDQDSLYLIERGNGRIRFGLTMHDGSTHEFELDDMGYAHIEAQPDVEIDALPSQPPE